MTAPSLLDELEAVVGLMCGFDRQRFTAELERWFRTHHAEIADMAKRVEVAERTLQRCKQTLDTTSECWRLDAERMEAAEMDAARYRWLRKRVDWKPLPEDATGKVYLVATMVSPTYGNTDGQVDDAIDDAMQKAKAHG